MKILHSCAILAMWGAAADISHLAAAEAPGEDKAAHTRKVTFELTFANRDLTWLGDAASPASLAYPKPGAQPIATDVRVTTLTETHPSRYRRYMREARTAKAGDARTVYAFTERSEQVIGTIDEQGRFAANEFFAKNRKLLPTWPTDASVLTYDGDQDLLYYEVDAPGPIVTESLDFLPLELVDTQGKAVAGQFAIEFAPADGNAGAAAVTLTLQSPGGKTVVIARADVPSVFRRGDLTLGSYDNASGTYLSESDYREQPRPASAAEPSVTVAFAGEFTSSVQSDAESLVVEPIARGADHSEAAPAKIAIDGNFDDWRNVAGVSDPQGDLVPYLEYVPDVDILEFKVAHDDQHLYLYARVAGQVGRTSPDGGRGYFYAYIDVDQNPGTGFLPSRDDDCYFGVDIGDDCEVQFEYVDNVFRKTFYGFCGLGGDDNVLRQQVTIGKSQYGRLDSRGVERENYKSEYTYRGGVTEITEDLKLGTSDTIRLAVSPDGSEVEVVSEFTGFLKNREGQPTIDLGRTIDLAAGMECDSKAYIGKKRWAADSTRAIRGYRLLPTDTSRAAAR